MEIPKKIFGYKFQNASLLEEALTHPSFKQVNNQDYDYNRLEFLGDSVLNLIIAELLFQEYPMLTEGELSILHAKFVSRDTLADVATEQGLAEKILMDHGEEKNGGRKNKNSLEDVFESCIAAIFLDSDYQNAKKIVAELFASLLKDASVTKNHKSALQEFLQQNHGINPEYILVEQTGKAHNPNFKVEVEIPDGTKFSATARTKKRAEFIAAEKALKHLEHSKNESNK